MSTITTIQSTDLITNSRTDINTNFSNLNTDKIETSYLDTDTTLAANSDSKIATQKAVKTYVDTQGGANATSSVRGIVELATAAEITAGTATGGSGAALVVTPDQLKLSSIPVVTVLTTTSTSIGSSTTQFDITNPSGTTFRYTFDGTGTDPSISAANNPVGSLISIVGGNFASGNQGVFVVTASDTNWFEVTNASGVVESNKTISTGTFHRQNSQFSKTTGAKYAVIEVQGSGADGGGCANSSGNEAGSGSGGGGGGYSKKTIASSSLASSEPYIIAPSNGNTVNVLNTQFGTYAKATSGLTGAEGSQGGVGGIGTLGDLNIKGGGGGGGFTDGATNQDGVSGIGGSSFYGGAAPGKGESGTSNGVNGGVYGGGASGGFCASSDDTASGGTGAQGVIIITEYF